MALICDSDAEGACITLHVSDRFDFSVHRGFHDACLARPRARSYVIDLEGVTCMDSSALGMLLMLREKAQASNQTVALSNCGGTVKQILDVANFGRLFAMR